MSSGSKSATALYTALLGHTAGEIPAKMTGVIEIDSETKPIDAAMELWKHNILGAPVWNDSIDKYVGFFDMRDILSAVIAASRSMQEEKDASKKEEAYASAMTKSLQDIKLDDLGTARVTVAYLARRHPFDYCTPQTALTKLCELLAVPNCHRVPICANEEGRCINMVSRSSLIKFMSEHVSPGDMDENIGDAGLEYRKEVISVKDSAPAFEAFELMDSKRLSGLAVVDEEDGTLMGNVSARDVKMAALDEGETAMETDILSYLASVRQRQIAKNGKSRYPVSQVRENSTVSHVVNTLVKTGYHRLFVVDSNNLPVGVISVSDILRFVLEKRTT